MPREGSLSIKDKWALDSQLGEMLRGLEKKEAPDFSGELMALMQDYRISQQDAIEMLKLMQHK